jgi:hypothetical protein
MKWPVVEARSTFFWTRPTSTVKCTIPGRTRHYYEIVWNDRRIWGATAA